MQTHGEIHVSVQTIRRLGLPVSEHVRVRAGAQMIWAKMIARKNMSATFRLSDGLATALNLHKRSGLRLRYDRENEAIHIGPLIGILIDFLPSRDEYDPKSVQAELIYLSYLGRSLPAQYFIFTPTGINWSNLTARGYVWSKGGLERGRWDGYTYPLPDVVYDRISTRVAQARSANTRRRLMELPHLKYFNPSFLNKWRVHQLLARNQELIPYLPETRILNRANLEDMAQKHKVLYLKPGNGSLGARIIKANTAENGIYYTIYNRGRRSGQVTGPAELLRVTSGIRGKRGYIVQQGIILGTFNGSPFDLRIIVQKNGAGEWMISKKLARVAPRGSSIANLSRGGTAETSQRVMTKVFRGNRSLIRTKNEELRHLCLTVARTLENHSQQIYGELGLDVGIDIRGNLWIIEVNSKPRKTTAASLSQAVVRNSFRRPLQYAIYLAGFKNAGQLMSGDNI